MGHRRSEITDDRIFQVPLEGDRSVDLDSSLLEYCSEEEVAEIRELNG